jgi:tetratricopeptide (TPR) repeat protein
MKELTILHIPATDNEQSRVHVSYRKDHTSQPQIREIEFHFSITEVERRLIQWYLEEYLIYPWGEFCTRAQQTEELMVRLGEQLFEAIFDSRETNALYAHVADDLANTRIVIHASDPTGIAIPWELMHDPVLKEYGDLARLAHVFVRSQPDLIFETPTLLDRDTVNILMVICRPGGPEGDVPFQSVARPLVELLLPHRDRIHLDVLRPPTFEQLSRVLSEKPNFYHVLHFDGHGTFPQYGDPTQRYAHAGEQGRLLFEGEDGKPREVTGEELGGLLVGKGISTVLLNACQSGMTRPESLFPSVGNQLLKAGTCGVVSMAYSVYVQTAVRFMARLYEGFLNGEELARAVTLAREELRSHPERSSPIGDIKLSDWIVPVLFEATSIRLVEPQTAVSLDTKLLEDQQTVAGSEIDCPEPPAYGFVGRDGVMLKLEQAFQTENIVLLQGMAGVGKTEMAMGFGRWRANTGGLDGPIFFFKFGSYLPLAHVCDRVGQTFNQAIRQQLGQDWQLLNAEQRRQVVLTILKQVPCLLIWDNFEPVRGFPKGTQSVWTREEQEELRLFLRDLRGGRTMVLVTSRRDESWLGKIYRCVELSGLKLVEAQELALRVLRRAGLKPKEIKALPQYNDLFKYLRGNPLAIQIVLPELKRTSPDLLLDALRAGETTFSEEDPEQGREHSLTASLTYCLDALDPTLRKRLGILSLFQGFADADILAAMSQKVEGAPPLLFGLGRDDWIRILDTAAEVGLLRRVGEGLYTLHPALPWFFHDLLLEAFPKQEEWLECAFSSAYGSYGLSLQQLASRNTQLAMSLLRYEEDNLMHALRLARRHEHWDDVEGILYGLVQLLTMQGRWVEWERLIAGIEAEMTDSQGEPLKGRETLWRALLGHRSEISEYRRDFENAKSIRMRLKTHYEKVHDDRNVAASLHNLGMIAQERRQFDEAERWYRQSLAIVERIGDEYVQASTLHNLGNIADMRRQFDEAKRWYRKSLAIKERIGDELGQAQTLHNLGVIAQERRQFDEAERWYRKSLAIKERIGDEHGQAQTLHNLGVIAQKRQQLDEAERWYHKSLTIVERIGDEYGQTMPLHQLGRIAQERRQFDEAERWYRKSLAIKERIGDEHGQAQTLHQLGRIAQEQGDTQQALLLYEQAKTLLTRLNDSWNLEIVHKSIRRVKGE